MTAADMIGNWGCYRTVRFGHEKVSAKPRGVMTFRADGTGTLKLLFVPMSFTWSVNGGNLQICNSVNGEPLPVRTTKDGFEVGEGMSYTIYQKL